MEVSFHGIFTCLRLAATYFGHGYCYLGCPKPIIWQAWCIHLSILGAILTAWGHLGGPWEQQEGHMEARNLIFGHLEVIYYLLLIMNSELLINY